MLTDSPARVRRLMGARHELDLIVYRVDDSGDKWGWSLCDRQQVPIARSTTHRRSKSRTFDDCAAELRHVFGVQLEHRGATLVRTDKELRFAVRSLDDVDEVPYPRGLFP